MLVVETIAKIRRAFFRDGKPIKAICRDLGVSRKVVRKVIRSGATEFRYEREVQPLPKIGRWSDELDQLLTANEGKPPRERLTLIRIFEELLPAQFVKPFVKSNKNDARDAEAIAEAVIRPTMRFVEIKPCEQIDLQALHRVRDRIVGNRTQLICQMRAFCLEYGIAIRPGTGAFMLDISRIITDETNDLTPAIQVLLKELWEELKIVDIRLATVSR